MKKLLLIVMVLCMVSQVSYGKTKKRKGKADEYKGYYGFSIGPSLPMGDFKGPDEEKYLGSQVTGIHIAFANVGYKISGPFGICGQLFAGANRADYTKMSFPLNDKDAYWSYGGFLIGPLFSFDISDFAIDLRPQYGVALVFTPELNYDDGGVIFKSDHTTGGGYDIGATFRYKFSPKAGIGLNLDYFGTDVKYTREVDGFDPQKMTQQLNVLGIGLTVVVGL